MGSFYPDSFRDFADTASKRPQLVFEIGFFEFLARFAQGQIESGQRVFALRIDSDT